MGVLLCVVYIARGRAHEGIRGGDWLRPGAGVCVLWPDCGLLLCWLGGAEGSDALVVGF